MPARESTLIERERERKRETERGGEREDKERQTSRENLWVSAEFPEA